jgi:hypothetical protein
MIKAWFMNIPKMIGLMLLALFVHTYLLVVVNEGFSYSSTWASGILALEGQVTSGTLFWTLLGGLASTAYYKLRRREMKKTLENIHSMPTWIRGSMKGAAGLALPILLVGGAAAMLISFLFNNALISLQLALIMAGAMVAQQQSLFVLALRLGWSDWNHSFKKDQYMQFNIAWAGAAITGATLGFFLSTVLPLGSSLGYILILLVLGFVAIQVMKQKGSRSVGILLILFYTLALIFIPAFADDGGWSEAQYGGGNPYLNWLNSQGAIIAILMGLPPAIGAAIGAGLGAAAAGMTPAGPPSPPGEPPDELELTDYRGVHRYVHRDPATGQYISEDGTIVDLDRWDEANRNAAEGAKWTHEQAMKPDWLGEEVKERIKEQERAAEQKSKMTKPTVRQKPEISDLDGANTYGGYIRNLLGDFGKGVWEDVSSLPGYIAETGKAAGMAIKTYASDAVKELRDPTNYEALYEGGVKTVADIIKHPLSSTEQVTKFYGDVGLTGVHIAKSIAEHPITFAENVIGIDNWEKVIDPNIPFGERVGRAFFGAIDMGLTISTAGETAAWLKGAKGSVAVDLVKSAGKTGMTEVVDEGAKLGKATKAAETETYIARRDAWQEAQKIGKGKVDEFSKALESGDPDTIHKAMLDAQSDKQALYDFNRSAGFARKPRSARKV